MFKLTRKLNCSIEALPAPNKGVNPFYTRFTRNLQLASACELKGSRLEREEGVSAVWLANHAAAVMETNVYNYKLLYLYLSVCSYVCLYAVD